MRKDDVVHTYNGILQTQKRTKSCQMQQHGHNEIITLREVSQKEKYCTLSLLCGTENTVRTNVSMSQDSDTKRLVAARGMGAGEDWTGTLELVDANYYT